MNRTKAALVILTMAVGLLLPGTNAPAAPVALTAATPIYVPTLITSSGTYRVTTNITSTTQPIIDITGTGAEDVVIDLNGFTLTVGGGFDAIHASNIRRLTVQNGRISDPTSSGGDGIFVGAAVSVQIIGIETFGMRKGIFLDGPRHFVIADNTVIQSTVWGIEANGTTVAPGTIQGTIRGNLVRDSAQIGIRVASNHANVEVSSNTVEVVNGDGIRFSFGDSCTVASNRVRGATGDGIELASMTNCTVTGNIVTNSMNGIALNTADSNIIDENIAMANTDHGVVVSGNNNDLTDNRMRGNGGHGLWFQSGANGNFFQDNVARGNAGTAPGGTCPPVPCGTSPDYCNDGAANTSGGNNYVPGPAC